MKKNSILKSIMIGTPEIEIFIRQSSRSRKISLKLSRFDNKVYLTVPNEGFIGQAEEFAREKEIWVRKQLNSLPSAIRIKPGVFITIDGVPRRVSISEMRCVSLSDSDLIIPFNDNKFEVRVKVFLIELARQRFLELTEFYSLKIGRNFKSITLRDTKSRWGSCSIEGNLMYSWRLIFAPKEVLEYLVVHEICHLEEMNHSERFWNRVESLMPDFKTNREWLKVNGSELHRYLI
ncbi:MAG: SprT family zinc-dependent metalloprotease [Proteobacteria bacterium]|jgi:predicted metal-dependent hydrolase|nr:SprT family zinc-dependent metalloprotease [Pseudomonadota bacterium]